jgi:carbamoyl-phosphate synthase small subunit
VHAAGLIIRDLPLIASNFRSTQSLSDYLKAENIVAIAGIDTRKLTVSCARRARSPAPSSRHAGQRAVRDPGAGPGPLVPGLSGMDLAKVVTVKEKYEFTETEWALGEGYGKLADPSSTWSPTTSASSATSCAC